MRQQSDTSGHHAASHSLALVPFRTLLSEIQLEERLGSGAGGTTWKCRWRTATVAIKLMVSTSVDQLRASTREAVCSRIVSHPCVVQCYAINIARLTEQDMELLAAAAAPPPPGRDAVAAGGAAAALFVPASSPPPLVCLGTSPTLALGDQQSHFPSPSPLPLLPPPQPQYAPGWELPREEASEPGKAGIQHAQQQQQQRGGIQPHGEVAAAVEALAATAAAAAGRHMPMDLAAVGVEPITVPAPAAAAAAKPAPSISPMLTGPAAAIDDSTDGELLLLQAAAAGAGAVALSERITRPLLPSPPPAAEDRPTAGKARLSMPEAAAAAPPAAAAAPLATTPSTVAALLREQAQASPSHQAPSLGLGLFPERAGGGAAAAAAFALARPSSMAWWNDASESLLLELDPGDHATALREELLRMGAAPGKFLTAIIMEWCDGGTLHEEFTQLAPHHHHHTGGLRPGLRHSGLASGHLLRGLGPTTHSPLLAHGMGDAASLPRACRVSDHAGGGTRRGGGGAVGGGGFAPSSGSHSLGGPAQHISEFACADSGRSGPCMRAFGGNSVGGGFAGGGAAAATASPRSLPICSSLRNSMPAVRSLGSPMYGGGGAAAAAAPTRSAQQPHVCHAVAAPPLGSAAPFGSFIVPPPRPPPAQQGTAVELQERHQTEQRCPKQSQQDACQMSAIVAAAVVVDPPPVDAQGGSGGGAAANTGGGCGCASSSSFASGGYNSTAGRTAVLLRCALEVAQGMSYLHSLNLAHGDLTPKNVLLKSTATSRRGFTCKISDFGLSNPTTTGNCLSADTSRWGTLSYLAPEVLTGRGTLKQADVYSFGAVLWHMCTGRPPHQELRPAQLLVGLATGDLQLAWPEGTDPGVARIGRACMDPDPAKRPEFEEIVRMLLAEITTRSRSARRRAVEGGGAGGRRGSAGYGSGGGGPPAAYPAWSSPIAVPVAARTAAVCMDAGASLGGSPMAWVPVSISASASASGSARMVVAPAAPSASLHGQQQQHKQPQQHQQQQLGPLRSGGGAAPLKAQAPPQPPVQSHPQTPHPHQQQQPPAASSAAAQRCCEWQPVPLPPPALPAGPQRRPG